MNVYYKHQQPLHKQQTTPYKCVLCKKEYKLKSNYTKHTLLCETINKTQHERIRENDTDKMPTMREMYSILLEVTAKYSQLEKKIE
jgi:DNA-directed RNA polymerase subunit RPC12/RpoP